MGLLDISEAGQWSGESNGLLQRNTVENFPKSWKQ